MSKRLLLLNGQNQTFLRHTQLFQQIKDDDASGNLDDRVQNLEIVIGGALMSQGVSRVLGGVSPLLWVRNQRFPGGSQTLNQAQEALLTALSEIPQSCSADSSGCRYT